MHKFTPVSQDVFEGLTVTDTEIINRALAIVAKIPEDPRYYRPKGVEVAVVLKQFNVDVNTLLAAILSDSRLATITPAPDIAGLFGATVAALVKDVNWLNKVTVYTPEMANQPNQTETLRRMLLSMTQDVRAVLVKLAYRAQRLRNLPKESYEIRLFIARETLDIYAPIANRLGIHQLKWELEDMAFRYLEPQEYRKIAKSLSDNRLQRENCINGFIKLLQQQLAESHIEAEIYGRPKHIYSIWKKMKRKKLAIDELYDLLAVRVIVDSLPTCYAVLGLVHANWQYIPKEFDDYIANPKENGYQSLHTVILDPNGNRIEVQIRTRDMHNFAELGVAAHWSYKEGGKHNAAIEKSVASLRKLLEEKSGADDLSEDFRSEIFNDRVYVLTPGGKLLDLVKGSTPLDFAYAVHSEIGHRCRGAKVNGRIVPLTYRLKSGDQVEILTAKSGGPNRNWLDPNLAYIKSSRAVNKVKSWFRQQQQAENIDVGKGILDKEYKRLGLKSIDLEELLEHFKMTDADRFFEALGRGDINNRQLAAALKIPELDDIPKKSDTHKLRPQSEVVVAGIDNLITHMAGCCSPVRGDDIIGFISYKKGIIIHRRDCSNIENLSPEQKTHLIEAEWSTGQPARYTVPIVIHAFNAQNLLNDVTQVLAHGRIHIDDASLKTHPDLSALLHMTIRIENTAQLSKVLSRIGQLPNVIDVRRKT
ncbi:MAG: RelA/SpoT family protein [Gammaproteobacteria bacterium]